MVNKKRWAYLRIFPIRCFMRIVASEQQKASKRRPLNRQLKIMEEGPSFPGAYMTSSGQSFGIYQNKSFERHKSNSGIL